MTLTTAQVIFSALGSAVRLGHDPADRWLCCLPLHHVGGLSVLLRAAVLGITVELHEGFDAGRVAAALDSGEVSLVSLVPTMLTRVLDAREERPFPASLRVILLGGGPADDALLARCRRLDAPVALTWGMTEAASQIATGEVGDLAPGGGVGAPHPFSRVTAGADGRLLVSGPIVPGGGLATQDAGEVDARGRVHVHGRLDAAILSGGELLDPREIEAALRRHPGIAEALVVALPDPRWGQRPGALLVPAAGPAAAGSPDGTAAPTGADALSAGALREWLGDHLARHKAPDRVWRVAAVPTTALGKPSREAARALLLGEQPQAGEGVEQLLRNGALAEGVEVHDDVGQPDDGAEVLVPGAADVVGERQRGGPEALDVAQHAQVLAHPHGALEVGLDVDQRHAPAAVVEDARQRVLTRGQQLLEGGVRVLEGAPEEGDAGAIDLEEANGEVVLEVLRHSHDSRWGTR